MPDTTPKTDKPAPDRKPFLAIAPDVDDEAIARLAEQKGVPVLTRAAPPRPRREIVVPDTAANDGTGDAGHGEIGRAGQGGAAAHRPEDRRPEDATPAPTPRARISYVKAGIPDYALVELKTRALHEKVSLNHLLLKALKATGITVHDADLVEDGRRLRGKAAELAGRS